MWQRPPRNAPDVTFTDVNDVGTVEELAEVLRHLRRRDARSRRDSEFTLRELAARTGWSHAVLGEYFAGRTLPHTGRFDELVRLLGASPAEQGALATARDRAEEDRRTRRSPTPRVLPPDVVGFTGRTEQLAILTAMLDEGVRPSAALICGAASVGKTALSVHFAHRVAHRFPDGQLHLDLRAYDQLEALAQLLRALGIENHDIPDDLDERAARYRSRLPRRRMFLLLDNARTPEQVRPLLPGTSTSFVLVTSRDELAGLVARDGVRRLHLSADRVPATR